MDPWPVVLKDLYWLNQFNGSVELQNDQFLRLLDISESSNDFSPLIALNVVPSNKVKILNSAENEITTERHINIPVRTLCFGCRQFVREGWNICSECGAILCKTCVAILNEQPEFSRMCPGNLFAGTNFHVYEAKIRS